LRKPPDGQYGALQPDGTWNGMVRIIQDKQADIAVASFTVTMDRSTVITFAQPITQIYHSLFIKNPTGSYNLNAYVEPLTHLSWAFIGIFALVVSPILFLTTR
jgi:ionotropic kainate glutamate receptor 5